MIIDKIKPQMCLYRLEFWNKILTCYFKETSSICEHVYDKSCSLGSESVLNYFGDIPIPVKCILFSKKYKICPGSKSFQARI